MPMVMLRMKRMVVVWSSLVRHAHVRLALCLPLGSKILLPYVALSTDLLDDFVRHTQCVSALPTKHWWRELT